MSEVYSSTAAAECGLQVWLGRGQPCAGHSWFQTVPAGSKGSVMHSWTSQPGWWHLWEEVHGTVDNLTLKQRESMGKEWQRQTSVLLATLAALTMSVVASLKGVWPAATAMGKLASALEITCGGQEGSSLTDLCKWRVVLKGPVEGSYPLPFPLDSSPFF